MMLYQFHFPSVSLFCLSFSNLLGQAPWSTRTATLCWPGKPWSNSWTWNLFGLFFHPSLFILCILSHWSSRSIGICNFNHKQLQRVLEIARIPPAVNQVESHPYLNQEKLIHFCRSHDIAVTAYSPLGSPDRPWAKSSDPPLLDNKLVSELAMKYHRTSAQILIRLESLVLISLQNFPSPKIRFQVQRDVAVIPKSVTRERIIQNRQVFDFELTAEEMKVDALSKAVAVKYRFLSPHLGERISFSRWRTQFVKFAHIVRVFTPPPSLVEIISDIYSYIIFSHTYTSYVFSFFSSRRICLFVQSLCDLNIGWRACVPTIVVEEEGKQVEVPRDGKNQYFPFHEEY